MPTKKAAEIELQFSRLQTQELEVAVIGTTPLINNRMSVKARQQLLFPSGRMTPHDKASNLKHDPYTEFRSSPYKLVDPSAPTLLAVLGSMFKKAMMTAALDTPGASKAQIGRLVFVRGERIPLWGKPQLLCSVTRSADIGRTPDIRTRAIVPEWACLLTIQYVVPLMSTLSVGNLLINAGMTAGVADWRPEKGSGNYGQFEVVNPDDPRLAPIFEQGRLVQERALAEPEFYDDETEELLVWYETEYLRRRGTPLLPTNGSLSEEEIEEAEMEVVA